MFGTIEIFQIVILVAALSAAVTDFLWGKIYNKLTFPVALSGVIYSSYLMGVTGFSQAILGLLAGLILYGWMFGIKILGGGDVKFLMALGAWGGPRYTVDVAILGIILAGFFSIIILIVTGKMIDFIQRMYLFVVTFQVQMPKVDKKLTMPMGIPIGIAAIWVAFKNPIKGVFW